MDRVSFPEGVSTRRDRRLSVDDVSEKHICAPRGANPHRLTVTESRHRYRTVVRAGRDKRTTRPLHSLGTTDESLAKRKLAKLAALLAAGREVPDALANGD